MRANLGKEPRTMQHRNTMMGMMMDMCMRMPRFGSPL